MRLFKTKRYFSGAFAALAVLFFLPALSLAADNFFYSSASSTAPTYKVGQGVTFNVQARTGTSVDGGFGDTVSIALYDTTTNQPSDDNAIIISGGVTYASPANLAFSAGTLGFGITFGSGSNSEYVSIGDAALAAGAVYPSSGGFFVTGYLSDYYPLDFDSNNVPAVYTPPSPPFSGDILATSGISSSGGMWVDIPTAGGVTGTTGIDMAASSYAVTAVNGGYSFGGGAVLSNLFFKRAAGAGVSVFYQVILDYNGNLTDYNNPVTAEDTVFQGGASPNTTGNTSSLSVTYFEGPTYQKLMNNGQIILRIWSAASNSVSLMYEPTTGNPFSFIQVPYDQRNASPVKAAFNPSVVITSAASVPVSYIITNQFSSAVSLITFEIPNSPFGTQYWQVNGTPSASPAGPVITVTNPGAAPGTITLKYASGSLATNASVTVLMNLRTPDNVFSGWTFPLLSALNLSANPVPVVSAGPTIGTLAPPPTPGSFTAAPVSFNNGGAAVSLNWAQVTGQNAAGYIVSRSPAGANTFSPVSVINGNSTTSMVDTGVSNQPNSYDYNIVSVNAVAQSPSVVFSGVTPFANPGPPTSPQALTGGNNVQLSWTAPVSVPGSYALAGYLVYRDTSPSFAGAVTIATVVSPTTAYNDTSVTGANNYYYRVTAIDSQYLSTGAPPLGPHNSDYSSQVTGFPPGFPPTGITATLTSTTPDTLTVSWTAPTGNQGSPANYYLYRGVNGVPVTTGAPFQSLGNVTTYDDQAISSGNSYQYQVAAIYSGPVTTNFSNIALGNVGPPFPNNLTASPAGTGVTLTWNTDSQPVTGYVIYQNSIPILTTANPVTTIFDSISPADTLLTYQVAAVDSTGVTGALSTPVVTTARLPNTPSGLSALADATTRNQLDLNWNSTSEALVNGYKLYRGTSTAFPPAGSVTTTLGKVTVQTDPGRTPGTIYYYFLSAQNGLGGLSAPEGPVGLQVPPSVPASPNAISSASAVTLTWASNLAGDAVSHYSVYRTGGSGPATFLVSPSGGAAVTYSDPTAAPGVDYQYYVTATNSGGGAGVAGGESSSSTTITWGRLPQIPSGLTASVDSSNNVTLNWSAVTITDPNAQSVSILVNGTPTATVTPSATTYADPSLSSDTVYNFTIETSNTYGTGAQSSTASILTYPAAPTISSLTEASNGSVLLTWSVGQTHVTGYTVYRQKGSGAISPLAPVSVTGLSFPVTLSFTTQPGQNYTYYVSASNLTGESPLSTGQSLSQPPSIPAGLTALSGVSVSVTQVNLSWSANSATEGVTGYNVYRSATLSPIGSYALVAPGLTGTTYSDSPLNGATAYFYLVKAEANGVESLSNTNNAAAVTAYALPNTPAPPSLTPADKAIALTWSSVTATTYNISGYNLYRSNSASVTGPKINATPIPGTSFSDTGLTDGTSYYYFLQAVDSLGHGSALAGPVNETPVKAPGVPTSVSSKPGDGAAQITWTASVPGTLPIGSYLLIRLDQTASTLVTIGPLPASPTGYVDTGLNNAHIYVYQVQAVDNSNIESGVHESPLSAATTVSPNTNVNPPSSMNAVGGPAAVTLTWVDSFVGPLNGPVTGYQIFRATSQAGPYSVIGTALINVLVYNDTAVTDGQVYYYYMVGSNSNATPVVSANSVTVHATPALAPPAPTAFAGQDGNQSVTLTWAANPFQNNVAVSYYVVNRTVPSNTPVTISSPVTTYTDLGLTNGQTYDYTVQAVDQNGTIGSASGSVAGYPYVMAAPTPVTSTSDNTGVNLTWTAPGSSSFPVTGFAVFRVDAGATVVDSLADAVTTLSASPLFDSTGTLGQLYDYQVAGVDDKGHLGPASSPDLDGKANPPAPPSNFTALAGDKEIILDWEPEPKTTNSLPVSQYILTGSDNLAVTLTGQTYYVDTNSLNNSNLVNGTPVTYHLIAVDVAGQSGQYNASHESAAAPATAVGSPANVNPPTQVTALAVSGSEIQLTWAPADYEDKNISYYNVYRNSSFTGTYSKIAKVNNPLASPATLYDNTGLSPGTTYYYFVRSFDSISQKESCDSNHAYAATAAPTAGVPPVTVNEMAFDKNLFLPLTGQRLSIYYVIPTSGSVELAIYSIAGRPIRYLYPGNTPANSQSSTVWDGKDRNGDVVASGIYLIEIKAPGFHQVRKVAVVK